MTHIITWAISLLSIAGVIIRPFKLPEAVWAVSGAILLVVFRLILPSDGWSGVVKGLDVYLFLTGMMLLAESAREVKLFDWLAAHATRLSKGSPDRFFILIYLVGSIVTIFLSNDATAVVLTPAVATATKAAKVEKPLPYLLICAFIANAASFVLPISNPANLVIYGAHMPALAQWLSLYLLPSVAAIFITFIMLRFTQRKELYQKIETHIVIPDLSYGAKTALYGIAATTVVLLIASANDMALGMPTAIAGTITAIIVVLRAEIKPVVILKGVSWSILPLVAGLFVIVEALNKTGLTQALTNILNSSISNSVTATVWGSGLLMAFVSNLTNNLPAGLIAGNVVQAAHAPAIIKSAVLIAVDLGPNLSITGSLATILWLVTLRREGLTISFWTFLKLGALVMTTALLFSLASLFL